MVTVAFPSKRLDATFSLTSPAIARTSAVRARLTKYSVAIARHTLAGQHPGRQPGRAHSQPSGPAITTSYRQRHFLHVTSPSIRGSQSGFHARRKTHHRQITRLPHGSVVGADLVKCRA